VKQEEQHWSGDAPTRRLRHQGLKNLNFDLERFLFVPLQRLMRYKLLLLDLAKSVPGGGGGGEGSPGAERRSRNLQRTIGRLEKIVQAVNGEGNARPAQLTGPAPLN
jgi:hypothetical protein